MFEHETVNLKILKERAFNLRWATVPEGVIPLTAADPDFPCAPEIADKICEFANQRYWSYGPPEGLPLFRESFANWFREKRNVPADPALVFPVDSAAYGIFLICKAFLSPGDEAIIFDPVDYLFRYSIEQIGAKAVTFAIPPGTVATDFSRLEKLVGKKTRMICLCNPLNPTGKVFTKQELLELGEIACKYNLIIMSDEIWSDIVFSPHHYASIASVNEDIRNRTVTVTGFSKSYGLAGLRVGGVMASDKTHYDKLMDASLHRSTVHGANLISQVAAAAALDKCGYWLDAFLSHLHAMREVCVNSLNAMKGITCIAPEGCYVAFADIRGTGKSSSEIKDILMEKAKVAVVPGLKEWFGEGAEGYIRLSFATSEKILSDALTRIKNTIDNL